MFIDKVLDWLESIFGEELPEGMKKNHNEYILNVNKRAQETVEENKKRGHGRYYDCRRTNKETDEL